MKLLTKDGKLVVDEDGKALTVEDEADAAACECCGYCNCELPGASPTADLSYNLVDDDPCTINLADESEAGTCGEIVDWKWYKNGVLFSSAQNPTGILVDDGDEITLVVADVSGCFDSATMEVHCDSFICDYCSDSPVPSTVFGTLTLNPATYLPTDCRCTNLHGLSFSCVQEAGSCCWDSGEQGAFCPRSFFGVIHYRWARMRVCINEDVVGKYITADVTSDYAGIGGGANYIQLSFKKYIGAEGCRGARTLERIYPPGVATACMGAVTDPHPDNGFVDVTI
jgi:hypothetical protein